MVISNNYFQLNYFMVKTVLFIFLKSAVFRNSIIILDFTLPHIRMALTAKILN